MNITDLIPELKEKKSGLESKIKENNNYEIDYKQKHPTISLKIQKKNYELKNEEHENLMQILEQTGTKIGEIEEYKENHKEDKYFGIEIKNQSITKLQINDYDLKKVPCLKNIEQLTELDLGSNQISIIPAEIGQLTALRYLDLEKNQIKKIPIEIGQLRQLQCLELGGNQISALPKELGQLTALQYLDVCSNKLSALPKEIEQLALKELYLGRNKINSENKIVQELNQNGVKVYL